VKAGQTQSLSASLFIHEVDKAQENVGESGTNSLSIHPELTANSSTIIGMCFPEIGINQKGGNA
jgi:hypothetical protein